jgi:ABC-type uncharacterized transport system substrate-binding protein
MILRWPLRGFCLLLLGWLCCGPALAATDDGQAPARYRGKRILWVDSYHAGYEWTDGIGRGIQKVLADSGVELKIWRMDTKRNKSEAFGHQAGLRAKAVVEKFRPDVLIASDDNAQQYLVAPFLKDTDLPIVFCGVNKHPADYGYPRSNVTGMGEVDLTNELVFQMQPFAGGDRVGLLAGDTKTHRIIIENIRKQPFDGRLESCLVRTFDEFKQAFLRMQTEVDMLHLRNYTGIEGWDAEAAETFLLQNIRIPTGSVTPWMKRFVIFTLAKQPEEQGEYAAATALRILDGTRPGDIPLTQNSRAQLTLNLKMAHAAGIVLPVSLLQMAEVIGQEALQPLTSELVE